MFDSPQESLRSLIQLSPLAILQLDLDDKVSFWNKAAEDIFGWSESEVLGKANPIIPAESDREYRQSTIEVLQGSTINGKPVHRRHKDGRLIEARLWASASYKEQKITGIVAILEDVTLLKESQSEFRLTRLREKQVHAELGRSEERMRLALAAAKIGWWDLDLVTREMTWSRTTAEQMRLPEDSPQRFDLFMKAVHPEDRKTIEDAVRAAGHYNADPEFLYRIVWPDGSIHWRSVVGRAFRDADGTPVRMLGVGMDRDTSRAADDRLRLQAAALQAAADSIVISDSHGKVLWTNPAFTELTGYSADEIVGKNLRLLKSGAHGSAFYANLWEQIRGGKIWRGEITDRRKDGRLYTEEMTITPVRVNGEKITNYIAIKHDVTARKVAEASLRRAEEKYRHIFEDAVIGVFRSPPMAVLSASTALWLSYMVTILQKS